MDLFGGVHAGKGNIILSKFERNIWSFKNLELDKGLKF